MDKDTLKEIDLIVNKAISTATTNAVAQMREFHLDDMTVLKERMDIGFESIDRRFKEVNNKFDAVNARFDTVDARFDVVDKRFDALEIRIDRMENALGTLLLEFKKHQDEVDDLKRKNHELTLRVQVLERQLATAH